MIIQVSFDRRCGGVMCVIPMINECNSEQFSTANSGTWVYYFDGKKHGKIPAIVLPELTDMFGGEHLIKQAGYTKHWLVFEDLSTNQYYFGNYPQFSKSKCEDDRLHAKNMMCIDINLLQTL